MQKEWRKAFNIEAKIPQAGMAVLGDIGNNTHFVKRFKEEYNKSLAWYKANPKKLVNLL